MEKKSYEKDKDVVINTVSSGSDKGVDVSICQYDGGEMKIQLSRWYTDEHGEKKFAKLGRLRIGELDFIIFAYQDMMKNLV